MIVVDASIALAWVLPDEDDAYALKVLDRVVEEGAWVPALWAVEVGNGLLMAERRRRLGPSQRQKALSLLRRLRLRIQPASLEVDFGEVLLLAQAHRLTAYDAAYLDLAVRTGCELATLEADLRRAAAKLGLGLAS